MGEINRGFWTVIFLVILLTFVNQNAFAAEEYSIARVNGEVEGIKGIFITGAGNIVMTEHMVKETVFYPMGTSVLTNEKYSAKEIKTGQHTYLYFRTGQIPIGRWEVTHPYGKCIHDDYHGEFNYYGISFGKQKCGQNYYSGWNGYCSDCNKKAVEFLIYMSKETAEDFCNIETGDSYVYLCPHCKNLEQARVFQGHYCISVSVNRYFVEYDANTGNGYMPESIFYYDNTAEYEGEAVTPRTTLEKCSFQKEGYKFAGWNTKADGSGYFFPDRSKILNLTEEQNGHIKLYAQWEKTKSSVMLLTNGGGYEGRKDPVFYGTIDECLKLNGNKINPPVSKKVSFNCQGGEKIENMSCKVVFSSFEMGTLFYGKYDNNAYYFTGIDKQQDTLEIKYRTEYIVLPTPKRTGYSFGGWYYDKEASKIAGLGGDRFTTSQDVTLYALWSDLSLQAKENYVAYGGSGATDLSWQQKDYLTKIYQVYQKKEGGNYEQVHRDLENNKIKEFSQTFTYCNSQQKYIVPENGIYEFELAASKGGDVSITLGGVNGNHKGGKGGMVRASFYLKKGDVLSIEIGGVASSHVTSSKVCGNGGIGSQFGNGGGYSMIVSKEKGTLMIAGGGGGSGFYEDGRAGGAPSDTVGNRNGEDGFCGGGGGAIGGNAGGATIHKHTASCRHVHVGNENVKGGCYNQPVICGCTEFKAKKIREIFYYGNRDNNGNKIFCVRCGSMECPGHHDEEYVYVCQRCGKEYESRVSRCEQLSRYAVNCGKSEGYQCGYRDNQVLSCQTGAGGKSYVNKNLALSFEFFTGINDGSGYLNIKGKEIQFLSERELKNVPSKDFAKPQKITETELIPLWNGKIRVIIKCPQDRGTTYEYMVKSFDSMTGKELCTSNQCKVTLISGIYGYRYKVDESATGQVSDKDAIILKSGENSALEIGSETNTRYLHIAAQDKAGNIGECVHIKLEPKSQNDWQVFTEQVSIEEGSNVCPAEEDKTYYVRASDNSRINIKVGAYINVEGKKEQQIQQLCCQFSTQTKEYKINYDIPVQDHNQNIMKYIGDEMEVSYSGKELTIRDGLGQAVRTEQGKRVVLEQQYVFQQDYHGEKIALTPSAVAGSTLLKNSDATEDQKHGIVLIPDAQGPEIVGIPDFDTLEKNAQLQLRAYDTVSGLKEFYVEIHNLDNDMFERILADEEGRIEFEISEDRMLFQGNYHILIYASDRVGNQSVYDNRGLGVSITAYLQRILPPQFPIFRSGESGKLTITTTGNLEKIQIIFPEEFCKFNPALNREIVCSPVMDYRIDEIEFMVPLDVEEGDYEITVIGYKNGSNISQYPEILKLKVQGRITDLIRTRLR